MKWVWLMDGWRVKQIHLEPATLVNVIITHLSALKLYF